MRNKVLSFLLRECPFIKECDNLVNPYTFNGRCHSFKEWADCLSYHGFKFTISSEKREIERKKREAKREKGRDKMLRRFKVRDLGIEFTPRAWKERINLKISDKELNALFEQPIIEESNERQIETEETN